MVRVAPFFLTHGVYAIFSGVWDLDRFQIVEMTFRVTQSHWQRYCSIDHIMNQAQSEYKHSLTFRVRALLP